MPKFPKGALTLEKDVIGPAQIIFDGSAAGMPIDKPPVIDTKPRAPAEMPVPASTLVSEVIF